MGRTYLDLCNDVLREMYYEEATSFNDLNTTEGKKVKAKLNQILTEVCNNEQNIWTFRERIKDIYVVADQQEYPMVNGFIESIRPMDNRVPLFYNPNFNYLPLKSHGTPTQYWIYADKINLYPIPSSSQNGKQFRIRYLTKDCAKDINNNCLPKMVSATDEPIIPEEFRDVLVYGVCKDLRASSGDAKSDFFYKRYIDIYRSMLYNCVRTADYPNGNVMINDMPSNLQVNLQAFYNPYAGGR